MDIIAIAVALKKAISQTKDIIASHFVAGTNIEITDNPDGTQTISTSGEVSATDEVARQAISDHEANVNNPHSVTKNQIGLGNVDNTSDADKPISAATQTALNGKQPTINSSNPLSSDSVDDTNSAHKFATAAELAQIATNTDDINTINGFLENTKIESWNIADTGKLYENTYVNTEGGGITHYYEPYFTLTDIEIPAGATTLYFDCTALENQNAGAYSMFFLGSLEGFIPTGKSIAIPNNSTKLEITFPYVDGDYTNKTKGKYYVSFETPTGRYDTITIDGVSTNVVPKEVFDDDLAGKQDTISDLSTIRSNASAGVGAAEVVTGIDETGNNFISMKSGVREYLATTVPTGNIPTDSIGMGFDEGVYTYKSKAKVSEGEPNLTYGKQFSFYSNGQTLTDYTIYGDTGGVGDKTAQLFDVSTATHERITWSTGAVQSDNEYTMSDYIPVEVGKTYTCSTNAWFVGYDSNDTYLGTYNEGEWNKNGLKATTTFINSATLNAAKIRLLKKATSLSSVMLNEGDTALPYEPYGYKIPVICGGQTNIIYLTNPLGANDSIDYATAQVAIPTVDGANTLICDTTVQPSKVSLTYTGWHSDLDDTTARIEALENAPAPSGGMTYDTLYEGTTISSYPYPLSHPITDYKFIIIAVGYSNIYTNAVVPVAVWSTVTSGGNNYDITVDTAQLRVNASEIVPRSANNRIVYGIYGIK